MQFCALQVLFYPSICLAADENTTYKVVTALFLKATQNVQAIRELVEWYLLGVGSGEQVSFGGIGDVNQFFAIASGQQ